MWELKDTSMSRSRCPITYTEELIMIERPEEVRWQSLYGLSMEPAASVAARRRVEAGLSSRKRCSLRAEKFESEADVISRGSRSGRTGRIVKVFNCPDLHVELTC
jgi:hypothetical protein